MSRVGHFMWDDTEAGGFWVQWLVGSGSNCQFMGPPKHYTTVESYMADVASVQADQPPTLNTIWPLHIRNDIDKLKRAKVCEGCEHMKKQPTCAACNYCEKLPGEPNKHRLYDAIARGVCPMGKFTELTHAANL